MRVEKLFRGDCLITLPIVLVRVGACCVVQAVKVALVVAFRGVMPDWWLIGTVPEMCILTLSILEVGKLGGRGKELVVGLAARCSVRVRERIALGGSVRQRGLETGVRLGIEWLLPGFEQALLINTLVGKGVVGTRVEVVDCRDKGLFGWRGRGTARTRGGRGIAPGG